MKASAALAGAAFAAVGCAGDGAGGRAGRDPSGPLHAVPAREGAERVGGGVGTAEADRRVPSSG